jgi:hypothetical protein
VTVVVPKLGDNVVDFAFKSLSQNITFSGVLG